MKRKFLEKLLAAESSKHNAQFPLFSNFTEDWLSVKKQTVKQSTYESYVQLVNFHLLPQFGNYHINEITRKEIQEFLFTFVNDGRNRTAQKLYTMLKAIFAVACEDYSIKSPITKVTLPHFEIKKGKAFTKTDEKTIIDFCKDNPHYTANSAILILLYTGMRVGELASMTCDDKFIYCKSEKTRKGYAEVIREIPISPMLRRILPLIDFEQAKTTSRHTVRDAVKRIFSDRHTHELRYTFITRAKEMGCNPELVMAWVGHEYDADVKTSKVDRGYTDYSQEYILQEINKIDYKL